jgi:adhesin/invasin
VCAADKVTCNVASPNAAYASGWFSSTVYATVSTAVGPGQNGFFIWNFTVPAGTAAGTVATFNGDVGDIATGLEYRPEGYFQQNKTPSAGGGLTISPASASMPVGGTQQFTASGASAGATITWSVNGGCGAITNAGLFAATATNSATQPCNVVAASSDGLTATAPITVFGPASQIACSASPTSTIANGSNTVTFTFTLKDANGNTVSNASSPTITVNNETPSTITLSGGNSQVVTPSSGVATVTGTTTLTSGSIQVSASSTAPGNGSTSSLTGCNVIVSSSAPGASAKTASSFSPNPIAADGVSTSSLVVKVQDANGNTNVNDSSTVITITRDASSANICNITAVNGVAQTPSGSGSATASSGAATFTFKSTSTPGSCIEATTTNSTSVAGSTATLTTQIVGAPNKIVVTTNTTPAPAANPANYPGAGACNYTNFISNGTTTDPSCTKVTVQVQDVNGLRVTGDTGRTITATIDHNSCSSSTNSGGNSVYGSGKSSPGTTTFVTTAADAAVTGNDSSGSLSFAFGSRGAYSACTITFTSPAGSGGTPDVALASTTATLVWTAGGADHLTCAFSPTNITNDGASTSTATVRVRDVNGNTVTTGSYSVTFGKTTDNGATTLLTTNPQSTSSGSTTYTVRSTTKTGTNTDTYQATITSGSTPTLPLSAPNGTCDITTQPLL